MGGRIAPPEINGKPKAPMSELTGWVLIFGYWVLVYGLWSFHKRIQFLERRMRAVTALYEFEKGK